MTDQKKESWKEGRDCCSWDGVTCDTMGRDVIGLPNLRELSLISNPELRGAFPTTNWSNPLMFLDVSTTGFSGPLPNSIDNLKFLKHLGLSQCNFNGLIPASFGNLTQITELDLSGNNFVGELPSSLSNLKNPVFLESPIQQVKW